MNMKNHDWDSVFEECPEGFHNSVNSALTKISGMEENKMKSSWSKKLVITAAAVAAIGVTAFAASKVVSMSAHSSLLENVYTADEAEEKAKENDIDIECIDEFSNGYQFKEANLGDGSYDGEDGESIENYKFLYVAYENGDANVSLNIEPESEYMYDDMENKLAVTYNDTDIFKGEYVNKVVPPDYELTEQDQQDEASGAIVFSYGSDEVKVDNVRYAVWNEGGLHYCLMNTDSNLTADELVTMAQEIIDAQ